MFVFWIAAALLSAAAAALIVGRAAAAAKASALIEDPAVDLYRRQLTEVDDLAGRGLLDEADRRRAFAEAARRLLQAGRGAPPAANSTPRARMAVTLAAGAVALTGLGLYMVIGKPGLPDAPFAQRLAAWRVAPPETLDPPRMAALLEAMAPERSDDPQLYLFLGRARLAAGDGFGAMDALRRAVQLDPKSAEAQLWLGQAHLAVTQAGPAPPEAEAAFRNALALNPGDLAARYALGQVLISRGDVTGGLALWRALRDDLAADDPRRSAMDQEIAQTQKAAAPLMASNDPQADMIRGMVSGLAERLAQYPDDPQGWARLVRSYGVLGDTAAREAALSRARTLFAKRPKDLAVVETAAATPLTER